MKNFIQNNTDYTVDIVNLAPIKFDVPRSIFEQFKDTSKKDSSILVDLAEVMHQNRVTSAIKKLKADLFAVDLHWLVHAHGAIQILKLLKQTHPNSYTVIGGLTSSYFKGEIMSSFPFVDFLIIGDGCIPLLELIKQIKGNKDFSKVPNLLYREKGKIKVGLKRFLNDFKIIQNDNDFFGTI